MIVSLLVTVEKSEPLMSRLVNVDDSMNLGELSQVIDAAFGFSGAASHLYMGPERRGAGREVLSATPGPGERAEEEVRVADIKEMTYVYDPSANWNITVEVLGSSHLDGPTPLLIDALGPDVVEACNGPAMMTRFHAEARRITAGLTPEMDVAPLLLSFLPVMSPDRLLQRLAQADPVTVAERISYVAEDLFLDAADMIGDDPNTPQFAEEFEQFLDTRPDLRDILAMDPNPERNPALIAAMSQFFEETLGGEPFEEDEVRESLCVFLWEVLAQPGQRIKLTSTGALPPAHVSRIAVELGVDLFSPRPRESSMPSVRTIRRAMVEGGLLRESGGWLEATPRGESFLDDPYSVCTMNNELRSGFERAVGTDEWRKIIAWLVDVYGLGEEPELVPRDTDAARELMVALGVLEPSGIALTPSGQNFLAHMITD
ncbi:IS1096 element passenger TnpR family protein [Corynebacterium timonense]|uniref:PRiA4b ORF-3-like protein n=1 Tax=Corynebacterium timonense TaxID=441500 RepID=A0A1H1UQI9_9CORY|nr:hypothetical protein [Corynebacterium timonense]SDS74550.1 pRiA4b ORF-3-like protein [Corynebacterium timonense]